MKRINLSFDEQELADLDRALEIITSKVNADHLTVIPLPRTTFAANLVMLGVREILNRESET